MHSQAPEREALLRYLDGQVTPEEHRGIEQLLRTAPEARALLREVAEQAVRVADLERAALGQQSDMSSRFADAASPKRLFGAGRFRPWQRALAAAAVVLVVAVVAAELLRERTSAVMRVFKVTGARQLFGARGELEQALEAGARLRAGGTLETRSCDAWVERSSDREKELLGRYDESAYLWRMMKIVGHQDIELRELTDFDHGGMAEPAFPLLLEFIFQRTAPDARR